MNEIYAGIEAGGTKWICAIGCGPGEIYAQKHLHSAQPGETIPVVITFFCEQIQVFGQIEAIGIGCFGPLDLDIKSGTYGFLTTTIKPGWANTDVVGPFRQAFQVPVGFDTDPNAAALGEATWGAARSLDDFVYLTIGTGIGGGGMVNGRLIHGLIHPEMGHIRIPHDWEADPFPGICPFHGDCLEGLACGPALEARWGQPPQSLPPDHPAWQLEANYLALGLVNFILMMAPRQIILGGGVMRQGQLYPLVRMKVLELLRGYLPLLQMSEDLADYIVPPALGEESGVLGAIALARLAAHDHPPGSTQD